MPRIKPVKDIALVHDTEMSISKLHFAANISMGTARRYWHGTQDGAQNGKPMTIVDLPTIERVAKAIGVPWKELLEDDQIPEIRKPDFSGLRTLIEQSSK